MQNRWWIVVPVLVVALVGIGWLATRPGTPGESLNLNVADVTVTPSLERVTTVLTDGVTNLPVETVYFRGQQGQVARPGHHKLFWALAIGCVAAVGHIHKVLMRQLGSQGLEHTQAADATVKNPNRAAARWGFMGWAQSGTSD